MSEKNLKYYKGLDYNVIIEKEEMDDENWFIAYTTELGKYACYGRGETQIEALNNFLEEKDFFIEYLFKEGKNILEPQKEDSLSYSGFFNVRTSHIIHSNLVYQAKQQGVSLNMYINQVLSAAVENRKLESSIMDRFSEVCAKLDAHHSEVTKQLQYQIKNIENYKIVWAGEYYVSSPYLKTA